MKYKIIQIQVRWKSRIKILRPLNDKCTLLEEKKSIVFFKVVEAITKLGGPPMVKNSTLLSLNDLEYELSKLKEKWVEEFENLSNFLEENMKIWIVSYVNFNNDNTTILSQGREYISYIEKEFFDMKVKQGIPVPSLREYTIDWLEKPLGIVAKTD